MQKNFDPEFDYNEYYFEEIHRTYHLVSYGYLVSLGKL